MQDTNKKWDAISNICLNAAKKVLGERLKSKNNRYKNEEILKLLDKQKKMGGQIDSTQNRKLKAKKRKDQNKILSKIKALIKKEKENIVEEELEVIISKHTDVRKWFETVHLLNSKKPNN